MKKLEAESFDPIGLRGSPLQTLEAMHAALRTLDVKGSMVIVIADWQDRRDTARYAVLVRHGERSVLSEDAFGGRYGAAGKKALADLVNLLCNRGAENFKESVLAPHEFTRLLEDPSGQHLQRIIANANPSDPEIYR